MNRKFVFYVFGRIIQVVALLLLLPAVVSAIYGEMSSLWAFIITSACALAFGTVIALLCRTKNRIIYAKEGFAIVALAWLGMSAVGAVPFVISGEIPNYINALFETVSGFTTTGASILENVEAMSHGMLFWRRVSSFRVRKIPRKFFILYISF